ncbi:MAG: 3'-5' exonuclease, partial [Flavobacteriales bacterium]
MKLQLSIPLCFFDLETTGTDISKDRIVEIAILKLHPDGTQDKKEWRINPEQSIPPEVTAV